MIDFINDIYLIAWFILRFFSEIRPGGGGVNELSLLFIILLTHGLYCVFSVMSDINLDDPGFKAPGATTSAPPLSDSSVEIPPEARRKCIACPRRMSIKTADRHTLCVSCRGFDCDLESRCEECIEWPEEEVKSYAKYRKSLKSKDSSSRSKPSAPPPPPADSVPSSQPPARADMQSQVDSLHATVSSLAEDLSARLDALAASLLSPNMSQLSSQTRLGPDVGQPQPGVTTGTRRTFQALGVADRTFGVHFHPYANVGHDVRAPPPEQSGPSAAPQPHAALDAAPPPSASFVPPQPPPRYGDPPPQPSTSGWVPSGPPPTRSARDSRSSSESEASDAESDVSVRDSASSRLADLIYEVCPDSRPPRCGFEAWFGQPESTTSRPHFRLYPRVAEVESEVAARAEALARWAKPLSHIIPSRSRRYAITDLPLFASSLPVNPSFAQLAGARTMGFRHLFGDGTIGAIIPVSAGDDVLVSLADVRNSCHAET